MARKAVLVLVCTLLLACCFAAGGARAAGGLYLDDFCIRNNGSTVFFDNFSSGRMAGWTKMSDAVVSCTGRGSSRECSLLLNKHIYCGASAYHNVPIKDAGLVELTTRIYVTPPDEQYDHRKGTYCMLYITLYSASSSSEVCAIVNLNPGEDMNRIGIGSNYLKNGRKAGIGGTTPTPVLPPNQWATLTLQLDPSTGNISTILNGKAMVVRQYDPRNFASIREVGISSGYGDGSRRTD